MIRIACCLVLVALIVSPTVVNASLTAKKLESVKSWLESPSAERPATETLDLPDGLSNREAKKVTQQIWSLIQKQPIAEDSPLGPLPKTVRESMQNGRLDIQAKALELGEHTMPFVVLRREQAKPPKAGRPLFFCLHGGGAYPQATGPHSWPVNTREMQAQVQLSLGVYPSEGIYWIPRMADDRLGRWWHYHNQMAIDQVIDHAVTHWGVDPNRVYLMGISEGGYGTDILAPLHARPFCRRGGHGRRRGIGQSSCQSKERCFQY